jgi:hypothetical protein
MASNDDLGKAELSLVGLSVLELLGSSNSTPG